jgi:death-on-curing protein
VIEPRSLSTSIVLAIHADQIADHGGALGVRDKGMLESTIDRPRNRFQYEPESDLAALAAACGFGIARNHPFIDGNKRVAFQTVYVFLGLNGARLHAAEAEVVLIMLSLAVGELQEAHLADWLRQNSTAKS